MDMFNILKNFDAASKGEKASATSSEKNEMKAILESLQECGMGMPSAPMSPPMEDKVTMNVSLNAKGIDAIDDLVRLMGGKKEMEPTGMEMPVAISKPVDKHDDMAKLMAIASAEHGDDEEMESWDNSPEEEYSDHNTMLKDLSGGINRQKKMYAKAQDGDNAMAVQEDDELSEIKSQLSALWRAKVKSLDEADVQNPYQGADAEKFAAMSPEDQEWLTRGGGKPDINDPAILARAPNGGRPAAPAAAPAAQSGAGDEAAAQQMAAQRQAAAPASAGASAEGNAGEAEAQAAQAAQSAGPDDGTRGGQAPAAGASAEGNAGEAQAQAAAAKANTPTTGTPAAKPAPTTAQKPATKGGAGNATKADADGLTKAIKDFQTKAGLKADGIIGKDTLAALKAAQSAQAAPAQTGANTADPGAPAQSAPPVDYT